MNRWLALALVVALLDQASKLMASALLAPGETVPVLPFLDLRLAHNPGAASPGRGAGNAGSSPPWPWG